MDRHNPYLSYKYSTRIINFLNGQLEQKGINSLVAIKAAKYEEDFSKIDRNDQKAVKKIKKERNSKEKAKMSFGQLEIYRVNLL